MEIDFDPPKSDRTVRERGFDFFYAARVFLGSVVEWCDVREYGEVRIVAVGMIEGLEYTVVYTDRGDVRWIISARRANKKERKLWHEAFG